MRKVKKGEKKENSQKLLKGVCKRFLFRTHHWIRCGNQSMTNSL